MQPSYIKFELQFMPGFPKGPIVLTAECKQWAFVIQELLRYGVATWRERYDNSNICDGYSWSLTVKDRDFELKSSGLNDAPETFEDVRELLETAAAEH